MQVSATHTCTRTPAALSACLALAVAAAARKGGGALAVGGAALLGLGWLAQVQPGKGEGESCEDQPPLGERLCHSDWRLYVRQQNRAAAARQAAVALHILMTTAL